MFDTHVFRFGTVGGRGAAGALDMLDVLVLLNCFDSRDNCEVSIGGVGLLCYLKKF